MSTKTTQELVAPLAVLPDEGGDNRAIAKQCLENIEQNWFTFSRVMFRIYQQEEFKEWGYSNFKDYVEGELAFKYKTAMWRVAMGQAIEQFNVTPEDVEGMGGWTKFGFLTPKINKDMKRKDFLELIKMAKTMTAREVKDFVETSSNETQVVAKHATMSFLFTNESITVMNEALAVAMGLASSESKTVAIEYIVTEWLMNHNPKKAAEIQARLHPEPVVPVKEPKPRKERADVTKKAAKAAKPAGETEAPKAKKAAKKSSKK
jgi:hypothetical protein